MPGPTHTHTHIDMIRYPIFLNSAIVLVLFPSLLRYSGYVHCIMNIVHLRASVLRGTVNNQHETKLNYSVL